MHKYKYNSEKLKELESAISVPRLATYLRAADGDLQKAIELHAGNTELGLALFGPILNIELLLRNKCSLELATFFDKDEWYTAFPDSRGYEYLRDQISYAQRKLKKLNKNPAHPPQIIANVSLGFWIALFEKHLHRDLWIPALYKVFQYRPPSFNRHEAWEGLSEIRDMRNRIAHHEPLFNRDLIGFEKRMLNLAGYINPEFAFWTSCYSQLTEAWERADKIWLRSGYR